MKLAPSVLSADFANLLSSCKKVENAGCEYLHLDVMDGHFVPNITFGAPIIKSLRKDIEMVFDAHLMITDPDKFIPDLVDAGCDIITVHQEACTHLHRTIQNIKAYNVKAGVVLNPATPIETIKHILPDVDMVLLMSVNPGFGGQKFIPEVLEKIKALKRMIDERGLDIEIEVDGGVNSQNIKALVDAGADVLVAGSAIFNSEDIDLAVMNLRNAVKGK
ncbi:ribulose-phosphate 3-epimerase [Peptostreptococcus sp. D1]|uniref:ribulose-phosphate 3-epimerase n=1 Tax=Peptostreptococcus sp. D1 TaxID=72304 RepID=UPI0008E130D8|nr:ribulose-phosphate 3-epimerase [Peptostreptococcus sp. D1]SFE48860.1 ribulose-phosphate 3-epimerase [Peptostreptococcus sp. D1]